MPISKNSLIPHWKHKNLYHFLFMIALVAGLIVRFALFYQNFNIEDGDITSVYHIANHIITYKEFPYLGEANSIYTLLPHSPLYFYLVSLTLLIHNSIYTLGISGIILQAIFIIFTYIFAWLIFTPPIALLTGLLLIENQQFIAQTHVMYQRWYEQPLFAASYMFLALSYTRDSPRHALYAAICFTIALGIGLHGYAAVPIFLLFGIITLRKIHATMSTYIQTAIAMIVVWLLCYAPVLWHLAKNNHLFFALEEQVYVPSVSGYIYEFLHNILLLFQGTFYSDLLPPLVRVLLIGIFMSIVLSKFIKSHSKSPFTLPIIIYLFQIIAIASILQKDTRDYHFVAGFGVFVMLLASLSLSIGWKTKTDRIKTSICVAILMVIGAPSVHFLQQDMQKQNVASAQTQAIEAIYPYITQLQRQKGPSWAQTTSVELYGDTIIGRYDPTDNIFWPLLEKAAHTRLSETRSGITTPLTISPSTIFVICSDYKSVKHASESCNKAFLTRHPNFQSELIYTGDSEGKYILYLGTRKETTTK